MFLYHLLNEVLRGQMKCISCETEINPKWKHAVDINVCPFCGKYIMEEHLKNLFSSLNKTMEELRKYPDQLNDWILSNYSFIKTDSPNLKNFLPKEVIKELRKEIDNAEFQEKKQSIVKIKNANGEIEEVVVEKTQSEEKTSGFFERAEVLKGSGKTSNKGKAPVESEQPKSVAEKTQYLKELAKRIKSEGSEGIINEAGLASMISPESIDRADPETVAQLESFIDDGDIVSSGLVSESTGDDDDEIPSAVLSMASRAKKGSGGGANEADLQSLRDMQNKVKNAHKKLESGKGGFSRA